MKHFKNKVEQLSDDDVHAHWVEQSESLLRDLKTAPMRRGIKLVDHSGRAAVGLGDPEVRPAPTFYLTEGQFRQLYSVEWTDYDPNLLAPPFSAFYIKPDAPIENFSEHDGAAKVRKSKERFIGLYLYNEDDHFWIIGDIIDSPLVVGGYTFGRLMESFVARTNQDLCCADSDIAEDGHFVGLSICDRHEYQGAIANYSGAQKAARALVTFLLMLNNREVEVIEVLPQNRTERKRRNREGTEYRIRIPRSIGQVVSEVQRFERLGVRVAHQVRGHLRHFKNGNTTWVRQHFRGGIPDNFRDYDASRV